MTETVRHIARCRTCTYRVAVDAELRIYTVGGQPYAMCVLPILDEDWPTVDMWGQPLDAHVLAAQKASRPAIAVRFDRRPALDEAEVNAFKRNGLWCPCCRVLLTREAKPLKATLNPGKRCTRTCHNATSITCDCSCGGVNHSKGWTVERAIAHALEKAAVNHKHTAALIGAS
jgi:hypothetical protein